LFNIPAIVLCCNAARFPPSAVFPHGYVKYSFASHIATTFARHSHLVKNIFTHSLVILEVVDFLDGRVVTTYGYLDFEDEDVFVRDQGYHCEDIIRTAPFLLPYCFTPRIPADPLEYLVTHPDNRPL
jgi:hypothetical protein